MYKEDKFEKKLDKIVDKIASIDATLAAQHVSLKEHIHRTELLEKRMEHVEKQSSTLSGILKGIASIGVITAITKYFKS